MDPRMKIERSVRQSGYQLAFLLGLFAMAAPGPALADILGFTFTSGFGVLGGFGNDGCAAQNPGPLLNQSTPVQASRAVNCGFGFGEMTAAAGPGYLSASCDVTQTAGGTASSMEIRSEFHGTLTLTSATTENVPVSLNFLLRGQGTTSLSGVWRVQVFAQIAGSIMFSGNRSNDAASGNLIPPMDGTTHLVTTGVVQVATNTPHPFGMLLDTSAGAAEFTSQGAIGDPSTLTLPTSGPVFNLPEGVSVDIPELNVFDNHWTAPNVGVRDASELRFGLGALRPNPATRGRLSVDFILPASAPASLELFDIVGRRVMAREVGSLGAGQHTVDIAGGRAMTPGVYLVRLTQGTRADVRRAVMIGR